MAMRLRPAAIDDVRCPYLPVNDRLELIVLDGLVHGRLWLCSFRNLLQMFLKIGTRVAPDFIGLCRKSNDFHASTLLLDDQLKAKVTQPL